MKTVNVAELDLIIENSDFLLGAEFQSVIGTEDIITLKLWNDGPVWATFNLKSNKPFLLLSDGQVDLPRVLLKKAEKKPLNIFLTAHFKGEAVTSFERLKNFGRVVRIYFDVDKAKFIEFRAYPGGVNFIVVNGTKKVSWAKPLELQEANDDFVPDVVRSPSVIMAEGLGFLKNKFKPAKVNSEDSSKTNIAKEKIESALRFLKEDGYQKFSKILEEGGDLPKDLKAYYNSKLSLRENIEWGYEQQKLKAVKIERLEERLKSLSIKPKKAKASSTPKAANIKSGRFLQISDKVKAHCGKTAKENVDLLRKAKSWYVWMHLKDYPSGHLILEGPKNYDFSEGELREAALFLFSVAAPKKLHASDKVKFEVIFTESKFVKPIKGAKTGLVQPSRTRSRLYEWHKADVVKYS